MVKRIKILISGSQNTEYNISIELPEGKSIKWLSPARMKEQGQSLNISTNLTEDELISFVIE